MGVMPTPIVEPAYEPVDGLKRMLVLVGDYHTTEVRTQVGCRRSKERADGKKEGSSWPFGLQQFHLGFSRD